MLLYGLTILCTTLNNIIIAIFFSILMNGRHKILFVFLYSIYVPVILILLDVLDISEIVQGNPIRTILGLICSFVLLYFFFQEPFRKILLLFAIGSALQTLCTFVVAFPLAYAGFFKADMSPVYLTPEFVITQYLICLIYALLLFLLAAFIKSRQTNDYKGWNLLFLFALIQFLLSVSIYMGVEETISSLSLISSSLIGAICIFVDFILFYVLEHITKKIYLEESANFYKIQLAMQLELYKNFSAYGETLLQTKAQITESLSHAQHSLRNQDYRAAESILASLPKQLSCLRTVSYCENNIVNALLFIKHRQMAQLGIAFKYQVRLENDCFADQSDLCRILGNLLDNAIEACQKLSSGQTNQPQINLTCMPVKKALLIQVTNPFSGTLHLGKNGLPASSKKQAGHGLGLTAVQEIAKKYGGQVRIEKDKKFKLLSFSVFLFGKNIL